jgi:heterotetrameric sarcosine oxidase gamma subunit
MIGTRYDATLKRLTMQTLFDIRGSEAGMAAGLANAGIRLPVVRHQLQRDTSGIEVMRLGPRRVVILALPEAETALYSRLQAAFANVADADCALVSDMFVSFDLSGPGSQDVLRQGAPLDLSSQRFPADMATGTELWAVSVIMIRSSVDLTCFRIIVERSFAGYIENWLITATGGQSTLRPGVMMSPPASLRP